MLLAQAADTSKKAPVMQIKSIQVLKKSDVLIQRRPRTGESDIRQKWKKNAPPKVSVPRCLKTLV